MKKCGLNVEEPESSSERSLRLQSSAKLSLLLPLSQTHLLYYLHLLTETLVVMKEHKARRKNGGRAL